MFAGATGFCLSLIYALFSSSPPCPTYPLASTHVNSLSWLSYRCVPIFRSSFVFVSLSPPSSTSRRFTFHHFTSGGSAAASLRFGKDDLALGRAEFGRRFKRASQDRPPALRATPRWRWPFLVLLVSLTITALYRSLHAEFRMLRSSMIANHQNYTNDICAVMHAVSAEDGAFPTGMMMCAC